MARDSSGRLQILRLENTPAVIRIIQDVLSDVSAGIHGLIDIEELKSFAIKHQLARKGTGLNQAITIDADNLSRAIADRLDSVLKQYGLPTHILDDRRLSVALTGNHVMDLVPYVISGLKKALGRADNVVEQVNAPMFGRDAIPAPPPPPFEAPIFGRNRAPTPPPPPPFDAPMFGRNRAPAQAAVADDLSVNSSQASSTVDLLIDSESSGSSMHRSLPDILGQVREEGIGRGEFQLSRMQIAVSGVMMLSFALFASVVGIAAGIAGLIYAAQSSYLSAQAQALVLAMNGVRVLSSFVMLGASVAQIASNVAKAVQVVADTTRIANAGFLVGNVIGITTNVAQIGIQIKATADATDDSSRLIAGLSILDATIQLVLNIAGTIALGVWADWGDCQFSHFHDCRLVAQCGGDYNGSEIPPEL